MYKLLNSQKYPLANTENHKSVFLLHYTKAEYICEKLFVELDQSKRTKWMTVKQLQSWHHELYTMILFPCRPQISNYGQMWPAIRHSIATNLQSARSVAIEHHSHYFYAQRYERSGSILKLCID